MFCRILKLTDRNMVIFFLYDAQKRSLMCIPMQSAMAVCMVWEIQRLYWLDRAVGRSGRQRRPIIVNDYPGLTELRVTPQDMYS